MILIFRTENSRDVEMSVISEAIAGGCRLDGLEEGGSGDMKRCFQINGSEYEGYLLYTSDDLMNVNELLIVKIRTRTTAATVTAAKHCGPALAMWKCPYLVIGKASSSLRF